MLALTELAPSRDMSLLPQVVKGNIWCPLLIDHASRSRLLEAGLRTYMAVGKSALDIESYAVPRLARFMNEHLVLDGFV